MKMQELKTIQPFFEELGPDGKGLEIRYNDRNIERGDILVLSNWAAQSQEFTGHSKVAKVIYRIALNRVPNLQLETGPRVVSDPRLWEVFGLKFYEDGKAMKRTDALKLAHKLVS